MKKILTMKELENKYPGQWILLSNPVHNDLMEVTHGQLVYHSKDRDDVYRHAQKGHFPHTAILCVGKIPKDLVVVL